MCTMDMGENIKNSSFHDLFLSRSYASKEEFVQEYNKSYCQKSDATEELFLVISTELKKSICEGNIDNLKKFYSFVNYICNIENSAAPSETFDRMKITDLLVILACKYNQIDILKYIFGNILSISCKNDTINPRAKDETSHDAFYYAIHSGNVNLVYSLINDWPDKYFTVHPETLDEVLSSAFENLKLKNVPLPVEMEIVVKEELINLRFYSEELLAANAKYDLNNVKKRVELVVENIRFLKTYRNSEVNGKFIFVGKFLAQNLYILKNQLKFTYNKLPWEEIEFCLISFISSYTNHQQISLFFRTYLNKIKVLNYLDIFALRLKQEIIEKDLNIDNRNNFNEFPKSKRDVIVSEIINGCREFEKLYIDFQQIRDITSLEKIDYYIKIALSANPEQTEGRLILTRILQIISEYLKNTLQSPKVSTITSELILLSLSKDTRNILADLQNSKSYASSRMQIHENIDFLTNFQDDVKNLSNVIKNMICCSRKKAIWTILTEIVQSENLEEMEETAEIFKNVDLNKTFVETFCNTTESHDKLKKLIIELSENITDQTNYEKQRFDKIHQIINYEIQKYETNKYFDYVTFVGVLRCLNNSFHDDMIDESLFREIKIIVAELLEDYSKFDTNQLKEIVKLSISIFQSALSRIQDTNNLVKMNKLMYEIFYMTQIEIYDDTKWIEEFRVKISLQRKKLNDRISFDKQIPSEVEYNNNQLASKLSELKGVLKNCSSDEKFSFKNKKLQTVIEILVFDILLILENSQNLLEDNLLSFDEDTPLLIGKCLSDHLHRDDKLLFDPSIDIILNANKLISEDILKNTKKIGKFFLDDSLKLKTKYEERVFIITNQERMFEALEEGNLEILKDFLKKGADLNARSFELKTALHFAAKGSNLEVIKFVKNNVNLKFNSKDIYGQTPLHIAAKYGRKDIINFFLEIGIDFDDLDNFQEMPLHIAAKNGHKDAVEILMKDRYIEDMSGHKAILEAITNHHTDVAKFLLYKLSNFDHNQLGILPPLHSAIESCNLDLVNFLLENNKANVNSKSTRGAMVALHVAAMKGNLEIANILISNKADVNFTDKDGNTPLHYAVQRSYKMIAEILLKNGALVDFPNKLNRTSLHIATKYAFEEMVEILLKFKANPNCCDIGGNTCLHLAAQNNNFHIVSNLIENGALINAKDIKNATALHYAAENGNEMVGEILIKNGAEINAKDDHNQIPLHMAAFGGNEKFVEILIRNKADVKIRNTDGCTPLHLAALNGSTDILKILIENESEINIKNKFGMTALHVTVHNNHKDATELLLKNNADVNKKTSFGCTCLHLAAEEGHENILNLLIKYKANINAIASNNSNYTPLNTAVEHGHKEIVKILIENGANVNSCLLRAISLGYLDIVKIFIEKNVDIFMNENEDGGVNRLLLHVAADKGHKEIVNFLIEKGASVNAASNNGTTALHLAAQQGHKEIVEIFLSNNNNLLHSVDGYGETPIQLAIKNGHDNVVEILLKYGSEINFKDRDGKTPLEIAVYCGYLKILKMLLKKYNQNIDLNAKGMKGLTLLHIATRENNLEMLKFLLNQGADINSKNSRNMKSIHIAVEKGYKDIVKFFLDKGSNINDLGDENQTLLHYASSKGHLEIIKFFISKNADVNAKDMNNLTPLHLTQNEDIIKILLENGSFYNSTDKFGQKPSNKIFELIDKLFEAVKRNNFSEVKNLIKSGAFVNAKNAENYTPLHYAAWKGHEEIVEILLENNANPNSIGHQNLTPLHYAAKFSKFVIVELLLFNGAIYNPISANGKTPSEFAIDKSIINLLRLINSCFEKIQENNPELIDILLPMENMNILRILINACNQENQNLLISAMHNNYSKIEELKEITKGGNLSILYDTVSTFCVQGDYQSALNILNDASKRINALLGPDNATYIEIQMNIAKIIFKQGNYHEALKIRENIYKKQKEIFGANNQDTLNARSSIGLILHKLGKNEEALKIFEEVLKPQEELLGSDHHDVLITKLHMAITLCQEENYEKGMRLNKEVLEKCTDDLIALGAKSNIAVILNQQGNFEEALKMFKEIYEIKKIMLGINHNETIGILYNMAGILYKQKKYPEALKEFQKVLNMRKKIWNENHPEILQAKHIIGFILFSQSKFGSAYKIYKDNIDKMIEVLGSEHPIVLDVLEKMKFIQVQFEAAGTNVTEVLCNLQKEIYKFCSEGDSESIERSITYGADVNSKDNDGRTPLHYAISNGHTNIVNILLKNEADLTLVTNKGNTTLHTACSKGYKEIVEILLENINRDKLNNYLNAKTISGGNTALHVAVKNNSLEIVKILLKNGAIYNIKNTDNKMPIDFTNSANVIDLLQLIDDLFRYTENGNFNDLITKLDRIKSADVIEIIIKTRNYRGNTLLQVAGLNKHEKIARKILEMLKISDVKKFD